MNPTTQIIGVVALVFGIGVGAQIVADKLRVPSVMFLVIAGVSVGPEGLGLVTPEIFGDGLPAIIGLSVAIVVFEGAFNLRFERLREAPTETLRLVTVGAGISLLGTGFIVRYTIGAPWELALLIGALLVATGPTVITPITNAVPVRDRVASTLETEGVINDVTAAILALVVFDFVVIENAGPVGFATQFVARFGIGIVVGVSIAAIVWYLLRRIDLSERNAPMNARLAVMVSALVMYATAELVATEAGIAAVAAGGFVLGNAEIPYKDVIEEFKGDLSILVIAFVFVVLASLLSIDDFLSLGVGGIVAVVLIALLLRPALVMLCTIGDRLSLNERLFISFVGPRGIIPASVATLFALELRPTHPDLATMLVGTVFMVIFVTIVFEGGLARHIAQTLDVIPMRVLIVGGGRVGLTLAERLEDRGEEVLILEKDEETVEELRGEGWTVHHGDATQRETLEAAGANNAKVMAIATTSDDVNLLVGQLGKNTFGIETVISRVYRRENVDAFEDLDIEPISCPLSVAWSMDNIIERPSISRWMTQLDETGDVQEVEVLDEDRAGSTVNELQAELPDGVHIALITRNSTSQLPHPTDTVQLGDRLTLLGHREAVRQSLEYCNA